MCAAIPPGTLQQCQATMWSVSLKCCHSAAKKKPVNLSQVAFPTLTASQGQDVLNVYRRSLMNEALFRHAELQIATLTDLIRTCSL